jgi:putative transmembrane D-serine/D-alanine/glycine transporter
VGTTAAEATEPEVVLPKAINSIPVRILLFYILALGAIMSVTPWDQVDPNMSPFVNLFSLVGLVAAASVVNFVVISSATSSCNSGVYSTSRMLYSLANQGHAPAWARSLSKRLVPRNSLLVSCVLLLTSIPLMMLGGSIMDAFTLITSVSSVLFLFIWVMIVSGYVAFRRRRPEAFAASTFRLPGGYFSVGIIYLFIAAMLVVLALDKATFHAMIASALWLGALGLVGYLRFQRH